MNHGDAASKRSQDETRTRTKTPKQTSAGAHLTRLTILEGSQGGIRVNDGAADSLELCVHYKDLAST